MLRTSTQCISRTGREPRAGRDVQFQRPPLGSARCGKRLFGTICILKTINLLRQARDKHRKNIAFFLLSKNAFSAGPWQYPSGIVTSSEACRVADTEWHHCAWQYAFGTDEHELYLDGRLIWRLACPDGVPLVNDRVDHGAQFSVSTRPSGYTRYGGAFAFLGYGHWFGHIGDIRISDKRRY